MFCSIIFTAQRKRGDNTETVIYADVLTAINIYVTYILLVAVRCLLKIKTAKFSVAAASLLGGASSLLIFLDVGPVVSVIEKLAIAAVLVIVAFLPKSFRCFLKCFFLFFGVSLLFGGLMFALEYTLKPEGLVFYNGAVYFDVDIMFLVSVSLIGYGLIKLLDRFFMHRAAGTLYELSVCFRGKTVATRALYDTGNTLTDGLDGKPVIVCELSAAAPLFSYAELMFIKNPSFSADIPESLYGKFRLVPCDSLGGKNLLFAVQPDSCKITDGKCAVTNKNIMLAVADITLSDGSYRALLPVSSAEGGVKNDISEAEKLSEPLKA